MIQTGKFSPKTNRIPPDKVLDIRSHGLPIQVVGPLQPGTYVVKAYTRDPVQWRMVDLPSGPSAWRYLMPSKPSTQLGFKNSLIVASVVVTERVTFSVEQRGASSAFFQCTPTSIAPHIGKELSTFPSSYYSVRIQQVGFSISDAFCNWRPGDEVLDFVQAMQITLNDQDHRPPPADSYEIVPSVPAYAFSSFSIDHDGECQDLVIEEMMAGNAHFIVWSDSTFKIKNGTLYLRLPAGYYIAFKPVIETFRDLAFMRIERGRRSGHWRETDYDRWPMRLERPTYMGTVSAEETGVIESRRETGEGFSGDPPPVIATMALGSTSC